MGDLSAAESSVVERAMAEPMLDQVLAWSAINSGSRNLPGLERMAATLADAFSALPGDLELIDASPVESVDLSGKTIALEHGQNLRVKVRPDAPAPLPSSPMPNERSRQRSRPSLPNATSASTCTEASAARPSR
jgi:glutamate carboxypeptidase